MLHSGVKLVTVIVNIYLFIHHKELKLVAMVQPIIVSVIVNSNFMFTTVTLTF